MENNDTYLTAREVKAWLKLSRSTVHRYGQDGILPTVKIGNVVRFSKIGIQRRLKASAVVVSLLLVPSCAPAFAATRPPVPATAIRRSANDAVVARSGPRRGMASYYTLKSVNAEGNSGITASGEVYDETALTAALPSYQFGRLYRVCSVPPARHVHVASEALAETSSLRAVSKQSPSQCVVVRHNDYGPGRRATSKGVIIDLSKKSFEVLSPLSVGVIPITVEIVK